jgi:hypothetical protein
VRNYVYLAIRSDRPDLIKVGMTSDVRRRMVELSRALGAQVTAVHSDNIGRRAEQVERTAHRLLLDRKVHCEWFAADKDQALAALSKAKALCATGADRDLQKSLHLVPLACSTTRELKNSVTEIAREEGVTVSVLLDGIIREWVVRRSDRGLPSVPAIGSMPCPP